jgi:hypothetical protein
VTIDEPYFFHWQGAAVRWDSDKKQFAGTSQMGWEVVASPDGLRWRASIGLAGGTRSCLGDTPQSALNNARLEWIAAVAKLGTESP